jgi:hypothetical protein
MLKAVTVSTSYLNSTQILTATSGRSFRRAETIHKTCFSIPFAKPSGSSSSSVKDSPSPWSYSRLSGRPLSSAKRTTLDEYLCDTTSALRRWRRATHLDDGPFGGVPDLPELRTVSTLCVMGWGKGGGDVR